MNWTYIGVLIDNADMAKIAQVTGSTWIVVTHEQWLGSGPTSSPPARVGYQLFYDANDLMSRTIRASWNTPSYVTNLNGTPSIYEFYLAQYNGWWTVDGQFGFHYYDGTRDVDAATTIVRLFDPTGGTTSYPSSATNYNNLLTSVGATGNIGARDTLVTTTGRFNIQEANMGTPGQSWDKWRIWLYKFGDSYNFPTGTGTLTAISPQTPGGSTSFGGPTVTVVDNPNGSGKVLVVSYFVFSEGAASGEAGSLIYYFNIN